MSAANVTERIVSKPTVCGGKPCIAGTRIRVQDVYVWHDLQGLTADEIVSRYPQLRMSDIYAALAYFWEHRQEVLQQLDAQVARVEQMKQANPSLVQAKLMAQNASNDPVSSG